jgi:hypothetical protein
LALPRAIKGWTPTTLREKLIQIGAKVLTHATYIPFQLADIAVPWKRFARSLERMPACAQPVPGAEVYRGRHAGRNLVAVRPWYVARADGGGCGKEKRLVRGVAASDGANPVSTGARFWETILALIPSGVKISLKS